MKQDLIMDLHKLYLVCFSDCFDTNRTLMQKLMDRHRLHFKDKEQIPASACWRGDADVADKYFDTICPGLVMNGEQFACVCEQFIDFALWEQVKEAEQALGIAA